MDTDIITTLIQNGGLVVGGWLTYLGIKFTQRATARAAERQTDLDKTKVEAAAYQEARETWKDLLEDVRGQLKDNRTELEALEGKLKGYRQEISTLLDRVDDLERSALNDRRRLERVLAYTRELLDLLRLHKIEPPDPPLGLGLDPSPS